MLLDRASENFEYRQVFYKNQTFSYHPVANGANYVVTTPSSEAAAVLPIGVGLEQLRWVYGNAPDALAAPVAKGQKISHVEVWYGELCIAQSDLLAMNAVDTYVAPKEPEAQVKGTVEENSSAIIVTVSIAAGAVLLVALALFLTRMHRIRVMRARQRRRHYGRKR